MFKEILELCSAVLITGAFVPLIYAIVWRGYSPPLSTWIIWLALDIIVAVGMYQAGTLNGQMIGAIIGTSISVVVLMKYGSSGWSRTETNQIIFGLIGIGLWMYLGESIVGIITGCALLVYGGWPTFKHAWVHVEEYLGPENRAARLSWVIFWLSCPFQVAALGHPNTWTWAAALQPFTFLFIESVMVYLIFVRPLLNPRVAKAM